MEKRKQPSRYIPKRVKDAVKLRDGNICRNCGKTSEYMEWDHITPYSKGAPPTVDNIQRLCRKCNQMKGNKTSRECSKCGKWNAHDAEYCHHCGARQKKPNLKSSKGQSDLFWRIKRLIGWLLILLAVYLLLVQLKVIK